MSFSTVPSDHGGGGAAQGTIMNRDSKCITAAGCNISSGAGCYPLRFVACAATTTTTAWEGEGTPDEVRDKAENGSHSKRSAARNTRSLELSFGYVTDPTLVWTISKGERQTRQNGAHSSL